MLPVAPQPGAMQGVCSFSDPWMPSLPFKLNQARRRRIPKERHKVTGWRAYDASLRQRGSLTVWVTAEAIEGWRAQPRMTLGRQRKKSAELQPCGAVPLRLTRWLLLRSTTLQIKHGSAPCLAQAQCSGQPINAKTCPVSTASACPRPGVDGQHLEVQPLVCEETLVLGQIQLLGRIQGKAAG